MIYYKKLKECESKLEIIVERQSYLSYQLEEVRKTLKMINDDLEADRQDEDIYQTSRESEELIKIMNMEQREIEKSKYGEKQERDAETVADDILKAAGIDYKGEMK